MDMSGYKTSELKASVDLDAYAVRNEAERRQSLNAKKIARIQSNLIAAQREQDELGAAIKAAWAEIHS